MPEGARANMPCWSHTNIAARSRCTPEQAILMQPLSKQAINEVLDPFSKYNWLYTCSWKHYSFTVLLFQRTETGQYLTVLKSYRQPDWSRGALPEKTLPPYAYLCSSLLAPMFRTGLATCPPVFLYQEPSLVIQSRSLKISGKKNSIQDPYLHI